MARAQGARKKRAAVPGAASPPRPQSLLVSSRAGRSPKSRRPGGNKIEARETTTTLSFLTPAFKSKITFTKGDNALNWLSAAPVLPPHPPRSPTSACCCIPTEIKC